MRPTHRSHPFVAALLVLPLTLGAAPAPSPGPDGSGGALGAVAELAGEVVGTVGSVVTDAGDVLATTACRPPLVLEAATGCVRGVADGLLEYTGPDGVVGTVPRPHAHPRDEEGTVEGGDGHDDGEEAGGGDEGVVVAASSSRDLASTRRPVVCAPDGSHRTVVVYGYRAGANRLSQHLATIRASLERSNHAVAESGRRSGGPSADLRVRCGGDGQVAVSAVEVGSLRFADLRATVAAAGHRSPSEKYLVFVDAPSPDRNVSGTADMFVDARRSVNNLNNGGRSMYAVVYGGYFAGSVPLHELSHTMGAVQPEARGSDGAGHCTDQVDVLCYPDAGARCGAITFDCGNDTYFSTNTRSGQWLHHNWNVGWEGNRFIQLPRPRVPGTFSDTGGHTHDGMIAKAVEKGFVSGFADGTFRPDRAVSRGQASSLLAGAFSLEASRPANFSDVGTGTHSEAISAVAEARLVSGYPDGTFRPNAHITRGQLATILHRALRLPRGATGRFTDVAGSVHERSIDAVSAAGIVSGYSDGTFRPNRPVTRAQAATILVRAAAAR
ncbi:MAG: S-layer homology domain-containing protein [Nitriliruptor sp.]